LILNNLYPFKVFINVTSKPSLNTPKTKKNMNGKASRRFSAKGVESEKGKTTP
jgi:hypothetical protein